MRNLAVFLMAFVMVVSFYSVGQAEQTNATSTTRMSKGDGFYCFGGGKTKSKLVEYCFREEKKCEAWRKGFRDQVKLVVTSCKKTETAYCYTTVDKLNGARDTHCLGDMRTCRASRAVALNRHTDKVSTCEQFY